MAVLDAFSWSVLPALGVLSFLLAYCRGALHWMLPLLRQLRDPPSARFSLPVPPECARGWDGGEMLNELHLQCSANLEAIQCFDPATGRSLGIVRVDTSADVKAAVARARRAQPAWAKTTFAQRRSLLRSLLDFIVDNQATICAVVSRDTGKTAVDGYFGEILTTVERLRWTIANGEEVLRPEYRWPGPIMCYKAASVEYRPCGVVAALVSWNYPFHNFFGPVVSGLFAGNAVVIKVSEHVAWSAIYFKNVLDKWLTANGYSRDLVQCVIGYADTGEALVRSNIDKLTFIGSPQVGKAVMRAAADNLTPCILELGGKDFAIVRHDVEFERVLHILLRGTFQNAGQNCIGLERVIAHDSVYDKLVDALSCHVKKLRVGAPMEEENVDIGAMIQGHSQFRRLRVLIEDAVSSGARLLHGGQPYANPRYPSGLYFAPTLLVDVTPEMKIANEECFAPILVVMKYGKKGNDHIHDDDEAVEIANRCKYRLGGSVFGRNVIASRKVAAQCKCGMMNINDFASSYLCNLPFGGVGESGHGRFNGSEGLRGNCFVTAVTADRFDALGIRTAIPPQVRLPIQHTAIAETFLSGLIRAVFSRDLHGKMRGLWEITQMAAVSAGKEKLAGGRGKREE